MSNGQHPLNHNNCNLATLRSNAAFADFVEALNSILDELRTEYEEQEASEFQRGKIQIVKDILNHIAAQNIR